MRVQMGIVGKTTHVPLALMGDRVSKGAGVPVACGEAECHEWITWLIARCSLWSLFISVSRRIIYFVTARSVECLM